MAIPYFDRLPDTVVANILEQACKQVPHDTPSNAKLQQQQQQQLLCGIIPAVCKRWRQLSPSSPSISLTLRSKPSTKQFSTWLSHHGPHLHHLTLAASKREFLAELRFSSIYLSNLRSLKLIPHPLWPPDHTFPLIRRPVRGGIWRDVDPGGLHRTSLEQLTSVTRLELHASCLKRSSARAVELLPLTNLRELVVTGDLSGLNDALPHLVTSSWQHVTRLTLPVNSKTSAEDFEDLKGLKELRLEGSLEADQLVELPLQLPVTAVSVQVATPGDSSRLLGWLRGPSSRRLEKLGIKDALYMDDLLLQQLEALPELRQLVLEDADCKGEDLATLTQLTALTMTFATRHLRLPQLPTSLQKLSLGPEVCVIWCPQQQQQGEQQQQQQQQKQQEEQQEQQQGEEQQQQGEQLQPPEQQAATCLPHLRSLRVLCGTEYEFADLDERAMEAIGSFTTLRELDLSGKQQPPAAVVYLSDLTQLTSLAMNCVLTGADSDSLAALGELSKLKQLSLRGLQGNGWNVEPHAAMVLRGSLRQVTQLDVMLGLDPEDQDGCTRVSTWQEVRNAPLVC